MAFVSAKAAVRLGMGGQYTQRLDSYLKGEATRTIEREGYRVANGYISQRIKVAAEYAKNATERKYPTARERDPRRHPNPELPHLADSWDYQLASGPGGAKLINRHPKAAMLILGINNPSVISPGSYVNKNGTPVLVFPRRPAPAHLWADGRQVSSIPFTVTRPVPSSQRRVNENEAIPYRAIRNAFRSGRRG